MKIVLKNIFAFWIKTKNRTVNWLLEKHAAFCNLNISSFKDTKCEERLKSRRDEECCFKTDCTCETIYDCYEMRRWSVLEATSIAIIVITFLATALLFIF